MNDKKGKKGFLGKMSKVGKDFLEGMKEGVSEGVQEVKTTQKEKVPTYKEKLATRASQTSTAEGIYYSIWSWFWAMLLGSFIIISLIFFVAVNPKFILLGILLLIALPMWVIWCLIHMIPDIKIFGFTIFSRKQLSLKRQLSLGKEIARLFSREAIRESPWLFFLLYAYIAVFIIVMLLVVFS